MTGCRTVVSRHCPFEHKARWYRQPPTKDCGTGRSNVASFQIAVGVDFVEGEPAHICVQPPLPAIRPPFGPRVIVRTIAAFCATLLSLSTVAEPIVGRVVGVADGDTLTVLDALNHQHKIRLSGIDAPEGGQAFGNRSKQALSDCAFGKQVTVDGDKSDRYGRRVGKVTVSGVDCNLRQIEQGMAWHYVKYASERPAAESKAYAAAEVTARTAKHGLWADAHARAPWDWRDGGQQAQAAAKESSGDCDCSANKTCTGKRGGSYCLTDSGTKRYIAKN